MLALLLSAPAVATRAVECGSSPSGKDCFACDAGDGSSSIPGDCVACKNGKYLYTGRCHDDCDDFAGWGPWPAGGDQLFYRRCVELEPCAEGYWERSPPARDARVRDCVVATDCAALGMVPVVPATGTSDTVCRRVTAACGQFDGAPPTAAPSSSPHPSHGLAPGRLRF